MTYTVWGLHGEFLTNVEADSVQEALDLAISRGHTGAAEAKLKIEHTREP